jgi:hypothetical protein
MAGGGVSATPRPSLVDAAIAAKRVLILGNGGGGDVIQGIPVLNLLRTLGKMDIVVGGVNCAWVNDAGEPQEESSNPDPATFVLGPTLYPLSSLSDSERLRPHLASVAPTTRLYGNVLAEAVVARNHDVPAVVVDLSDGVGAAASDLDSWLAEAGIDLVIASDCGSDSFYTGAEVTPAHTSLVDMMTMGVLSKLSVDTIFCLGGYGVDGELILEELERNIAAAMRGGAFIGGWGLTQQDVLDIEAACEAYADPVQVFVPRAARGEIGWVKLKTVGPWGIPMRLTPMAAFMFFFDLQALVATVATTVPLIAGAATLSEAETVFEDAFGSPPETRLVKVARLRREAVANA